MAYRAVDNYVYYQAVRHFLRRRHKVASRGTEQFPAEAVFGDWGVLRPAPSHLGPPPWPRAEVRRKAGCWKSGTSGLMSGEGKRGRVRASTRALPRLYNSPTANMPQV